MYMIRLELQNCQKFYEFAMFTFQFFNDKTDQNNGIIVNFVTQKFKSKCLVCLSFLW